MQEDEQLTLDTMSSVKDVLRQYAIDFHKCSLTTRLYHDLGLDGEEAEDFLMDFSKKFNVDMSLLRFDDHFGPEWSILMLLPFYAKKFKGPRNANGQVIKIPITIGDLLDAAKARKWPNLSCRSPE